jgi:hypothetical protein
MTGKSTDFSAPALRPLLPASPQGPGPELPQRQFEFKRKRQPAACEPCREHKTKVPTVSPSFSRAFALLLPLARFLVEERYDTKKPICQCDGNRPSCNACIRRASECKFEAEPKETHFRALKRKYDALQSEASSMQQVFDLLQTRPEAEALSIFHKIRDGESHASILQCVRHGDLLLQLSSTGASSSRTDGCSRSDFGTSSSHSEPRSRPASRDTSSAASMLSRSRHESSARRRSTDEPSMPTSVANPSSPCSAMSE